LLLVEVEVVLLAMVVAVVVLEDIEQQQDYL
jgi:hypothetical protein